MNLINFKNFGSRIVKPISRPYNNVVSKVISNADVRAAIEHQKQKMNAPKPAGFEDGKPRGGFSGISIRPVLVG